MRKLFFLISALASAAYVIAAYGDDTDADEAQPAAIMSELLAAMYLTENGSSSDVTHVVFGDVNGDDQPDAVVTYTQGVGADDGNHFTQRIALFLRGTDRWDLAQHLRAGAKGERLVKPTRIDEDGKIWFEEMFWQAGDAMCCPSGRREMSMTFDGATLQ